MKADKQQLAAAVAPYLGSGEQVRQVIRARYGYHVPIHGPGFQVVHSIILPFGFRLIVVTDRSIVLFKTNWRHEVQELLARLSRERLIGPVAHHWTKVPTVGARLHIHRKFRDVVEQADRDLWNTRSDWSYAESMALRAPAPGHI